MMKASQAISDWVRGASSPNKIRDILSRDLEFEQIIHRTRNWLEENIARIKNVLINPEGISKQSDFNRKDKKTGNGTVRRNWQLAPDPLIPEYDNTARYN